MHKIFGLISILNFNVVRSRTITFKNLLQFMSGEGTRNNQIAVILIKGAVEHITRNKKTNFSRASKNVQETKTCLY